jgi:hypothetical protein
MPGARGGEGMKRYWRVQIELYKDGMVKAVVVRNKKAAVIPCERWCGENPKRDIMSSWHEDEVSAGEAVYEVLRASKKMREEEV